jgi:hypothetical protein
MEMHLLSKLQIPQSPVLKQLAVAWKIRKTLSTPLWLLKD